jgi:hypothetical protein
MVTVTPVAVLKVAVSVLVVELVEPGAGPLPEFQFADVLQLPLVVADHVSLAPRAFPPASARAHARPHAVNRGKDVKREREPRKAWDREFKWSMAWEWLLAQSLWGREAGTERGRKKMRAE